ncbi:MAG: hypothetical protein Q9168_007536, partial [Polycauliona sp. 1 TL-2023]
MSPQKTIQIIGSLNIDLITRTPRHPSPGETLTATSFSYGPGGKGANQAVACARLGRSNPNLSKKQISSPTTTSTPSSESASAGDADGDDHGSIRVQMIGAVGADFFGDYVRGELAGNGVDVSAVRKVEGEKTGTAVVIVEEGSGENRILFTAGANGGVVPSSSSSLLDGDEEGNRVEYDFDFEKGKGKKPDLIILQLEIPIATVIAIIASAKEAGVDVLLNPAPAPASSPPSSSSGGQEGGLPKHVYKGLTHLIMNETEAAILSRSLGDQDDQAADGEMGEKSKEGEGEDDWQTLCTRFHNLGVRNVVITL